MVIFQTFFCFLRPAFGHGRLGHPQSLKYLKYFGITRRYFFWFFRGAKNSHWKAWPWHKHKTQVQRRSLWPKCFTKLGLQNLRTPPGHLGEKIGSLPLTNFPVKCQNMREYPWSRDRPIIFFTDLFNQYRYWLIGIDTHHIGIIGCSCPLLLPTFFLLFLSFLSFALDSLRGNSRGWKFVSPIFWQKCVRI